MSKYFTHTAENINHITEMLITLGINEFKFCLENDCYVCDKLGNFFSVCKRQYSKTGNLVEKYEVTPLNGSVDRYGYRTYRITVDGVKKHLKGHRMMLNAWIGGQPEMCVNHIDGNKQNNSLSNLEWCTVAENNAHAITTGLYNPHINIGKLRRISPQEWMSIYILYKHCGYSLSELGRVNGCSHSTIKKVIQKIDRIMGEEMS